MPKNDEVVGGHVWTDAKDSYDSVIDAEDLFLFVDGCRAAVALVAAFLFGLDAGSAITIDANGSSIGGAESLKISQGGYVSAGTTVFLGFIGILIFCAVVTLERLDETALALSAIFLCLDFLFPSNFFLASLACWLIRSYVIFPDGTFGLLFAYIWRSVWRSAFVPNFAKSKLRIVTFCFPGSFMTDVSVLTTEESGAITS